MFSVSGYGGGGFGFLPLDPAKTVASGSGYSGGELGFLPLDPAKTVAREIDRDTERDQGLRVIFFDGSVRLWEGVILRSGRMRMPVRIRTHVCSAGCMHALVALPGRGWLVGAHEKRVRCSRHHAKITPTSAPFPRHDHHQQEQKQPHQQTTTTIFLFIKISRRATREELYCAYLVTAEPLPPRQHSYQHRARKTSFWRPRHRRATAPPFEGRRGRQVVPR